MPGEIGNPNKWFGKKVKKSFHGGLFSHNLFSLVLQAYLGHVT